AYRLTAIMLLPCAVGLYVVGHETLLLLGGNAWSNAGYLLVAMAPSILAQGWMNLGGSVLAARGKTGLLSALTGLSLLVFLQMFVLGYFVGGEVWPLPLGPALGMAWGLTIAFTVMLLGPFLWACLRAVEIPPLAVFATLRRPLWASLLMGLIVALVKSQLPSDWPLPARLFVQVAVGVLSYVALAWPEVCWLWSKRRERLYQPEA
ncbi:MAG TPA: polysaccharide biosynthesis C-terminal domain-containing protein, partial [Pirellulaceae bacterium]|nr:polysaccharide biosynthesis C-terminal domain-containing protein [Pirellulaceae bacterium]